MSRFNVLFFTFIPLDYGILPITMVTLHIHFKENGVCIFQLSNLLLSRWINYFVQMGSSQILREADPWMRTEVFEKA